jgi:hypothetical protein
MLLNCILLREAALTAEIGRGRADFGGLAHVLSVTSAPIITEPPHSLIVDDCTSLSNAIRPSMCANSDVSNESVDVWTGLPFAVMTQR